MTLWERADVCQRSSELSFASGPKPKAGWDTLLDLSSVSSPLLPPSSAEPELLEHHPVRPSLSDNSDLNVGGALGSSTARPHLLLWLLDSDKWLWPPLTCTDFWCGGGLRTGAPKADPRSYRMQHSWPYSVSSQIIIFVRKCLIAISRVVALKRRSAESILLRLALETGKPT